MKLYGETQQDQSATERASQEASGIALGVERPRTDDPAATPFEVQIHKQQPCKFQCRLTDAIVLVLCGIALTLAVCIGRKRIGLGANKNRSNLNYLSY